MFHFFKLQKNQNFCPNKKAISCKCQMNTLLVFNYLKFIVTTEEFEKASSEKIKMMESKRIYLENTILRENYESERKKLASTAEKLLNKGSKEAIDNLFKYTEDIQDAILERLRKEVVEKNEKKIVELVEEFTKGEQEELKKMEKLLKEQEKECGVVINRFNSVKEKYEMERIARKKLEYEVMEVKGNIRVFCRVRPAITEDEKFGLSETLKIPNDGEIIVAVLLLSHKIEQRTSSVIRNGLCFWTRIYSKGNISPNFTVCREVNERI